MTSLSAIFVDAFLEEEAKWQCAPEHDGDWMVFRTRGATMPETGGTRADCERWVSDRAAKAGFAAAKAEYLQGLLSGSWNLTALEVLEQLAGGE